MFESSLTGQTLTGFPRESLARETSSGPEPGVLDWYGRWGVNKLGGSGGMLPQENFLN